MIKRLFLTLILLSTSAHAVTVFGHSSSKVNKLRSTLETIKADYDAALARAKDLQLQLDAALANNNRQGESEKSYQGQIDALKRELQAYVNECARLRDVQSSYDAKASENTTLLAEFTKQVDRLTAATTKLEELESVINEMLDLPGKIFGTVDSAQ